MKIQVELLALEETPGNFREVEVDDSYHLPDLLEAVFMQGQNDICPIPGKRSVSVGDVLHLTVEGQKVYFVVMPCGFEEMTYEELVKFYLIDYRWRSFPSLFLDKVREK